MNMNAPLYVMKEVPIFGYTWWHLTIDYISTKANVIVLRQQPRNSSINWSADFGKYFNHWPDISAPMLQGIGCNNYMKIESKKIPTQHRKSQKLVWSILTIPEVYSLIESYQHLFHFLPHNSSHLGANTNRTILTEVDNNRQSNFISSFFLLECKLKQHWKSGPNHTCQGKGVFQLVYIKAKHFPTLTTYLDNGRWKTWNVNIQTLIKVTLVVASIRAIWQHLM